MAKYNLFNSQIEFSEAAEHFFDTLHRSLQAADRAEYEFKTWYLECKDILTVLKGYEKQAFRLLVLHANKPLFDDLTGLEIYDVSEATYDENCVVAEDIHSAFDAVADQYDAIVSEQEAAEEYRAERKASRSRVVGGGFGVGGALKGMATAGAMNAVSGMGHSIANAIGNAASAAVAASDKRALYESNNTYITLAQAIRSDIISCYFAHMEFVNTKKDEYFENPFDRDKAGALFESAKKVPEKQVALLIESFTCYPWGSDLLEFIFKAYPAERKNVWIIAERFHVDLHQTAEEAFSAFYDAEGTSSEEASQAAKAEILAQMQMLGIKSSATIDRIEVDGVRRLLQSYDVADEDERKKLFVALEVYDASLSNKATVVHEKLIWEIAKQYGVKLSTDEIEKVLGKLYTPNSGKTEAEALEAKAKIIKVMDTLGVSSSATFDALERDCLARICINYNNADEATCNEMIAKIKAYDALEKNKQGFLKDIQTRIEAIWSAEDGEIFDNLYLNTDIHNAAEVKSAIEFIKQKGRTSSSQKYLSALSGCTEENLKKAIQFQKQSTKIVFWCGLAFIALGLILLIAGLGWLLGLAVAGIGVVLLVYYYNLKKVWDCLTLNGTLIHKMISITGKEVRTTPVSNTTQNKGESNG